MIKPLVHVLGLALLLSTVLGIGRAGFVQAEIVAGLYAAEVPVADQSSAVLAKASKAAMAEVLVKVSGSVDVLQNPVIEAALAESRSHVQQYAYNRDPVSAGQLSVRFEFDSSYITALVIEAGAPLWTANRPAVLVWLVEEDANGRQFINWDSTPELAAGLVAEFSRRGIPVQLPLHDLTDSAAITPEDVWRLSGVMLLSASARYNAQDVLAGRFATLSAGGVAGDWAYLHGGSQAERSVTAASADLFLRDGVAMVAEAMAARYAVAAVTSPESGLPMAVAGVASYADYAALVAWLESIELIEHANVEWVRGDLIQLRLQAQADAAQLAAIIELNERLAPLPVGADPNILLNYQWQN